MNKLLLLLLLLLVLILSSLSFRTSITRTLSSSTSTISLSTSTISLSSTSTSSSSTSTSSSSSITTTTNTEQQPKHVRRIRYSGKYPKKYNEKYKELAGDNATIEKVINKGTTPAGRHLPIMVEECLEYLGLSNENEIKENIIVVDCTLGFGGHTIRILEKIKNKAGTVYAIDQDKETLENTSKRIQESTFNTSFRSFHKNFNETIEIIKSEGIVVDCLLADLGYSSMQIDNPERGFSYKYEGYLDMRMDRTRGSLTASDYLKKIPNAKKFSQVLMDNADFDEKDALLLAEKIVKCKNTLNTTISLANTIRDVYADAKIKMSKNELDSIIARVMQSIRIEINDEFGVLDKLLHDLPNMLSKGGRVVILCFHSGEDRRVKKAFKSGFNSGVYLKWGREVVIASSTERRKNPRSKCCKLRWAVKA